MICKTLGYVECTVDGVGNGLVVPSSSAQAITAMLINRPKQNDPRIDKLFFIITNLFASAPPPTTGLN